MNVPLSHRNKMWLAVFASLIPACGSRLDLGFDGPITSAPPQAPDGGIDESALWVMVSNLPGARSLAIDGSRIYWSGREVWSCERANCAATIVSHWHGDGESSAWTIAIRHNRLYLLADGEGILSCPLPTGCGATSATKLVDGAARIQSVSTAIASAIPSLDPFVVDDTHLYWLTSDGALHRCQLSSCMSTSEKLAARSGDAYGMTANETDIFLTVRTDMWKGEVMAIPKDKSPPRIIANSQHQPSGIALDGERVYWTNDYSQGTVASCLLAGCGSDEPVILATGQYMPTRLAIDDHNAYWLDAQRLEDGTGALMECPLAGCGDSPKVLAKSQFTDGPGLAIDETHVYWTNSKDPSGPGGDVSRVGK